jgi:hypothetical protein
VSRALAQRARDRGRCTDVGGESARADAFAFQCLDEGVEFALGASHESDVESLVSEGSGDLDA